MFRFVSHKRRRAFMQPFGMYERLRGLQGAHSITGYRNRIDLNTSALPSMAGTVKPSISAKKG
jgi:hypothetical protein